MSEPVTRLPEEAAPAFVEDDPDAAEPKLVVMVAAGAAAQQPFDDSLVAVYKLHGYASLNLLHLGFQAIYLGNLFLEACLKLGYVGDLLLEAWFKRAYLSVLLNKVKALQFFEVIFYKQADVVFQRS